MLVAPTWLLAGGGRTTLIVSFPTLPHPLYYIDMYGTYGTALRYRCLLPLFYRTVFVRFPDGTDKKKGSKQHHRGLPRRHVVALDE